jgi:fumarylacetoacetate (FAA) hydrolase family protein
MLDWLPDDWTSALLVGRIELGEGPTPVLVRQGRVIDVSRATPTVAQLLARPDPGATDGHDLGRLEDFGFRPAWEGPHGRARLLAPFDIQCIKASGVTFAVSAIERVIEERAGGDASRAHAIRAALTDRVGSDLADVKPGSEAAMRMKNALITDGLWSQYLEVAIGPDAEIFSKAPPLASVGAGELIGVRSDSAWNNPEPEVVLACAPTGEIKGATLGNDVNLRDFEGRSALLLSKAKDNNASCAIGPFIRLFDDGFTLDDVRRATVALEIDGEDGFRLEGSSSMALISRDPLDLVKQTVDKNHQYPDGFALFLGTMFAPIQDRDAPGQGYTHKRGDIVQVSSPKLGRLVNKVVGCDEAPPWTFGIAALFANLAQRGLIGSA